MIMEGIRAYFPNSPQRNFDELGIPSDAKEAALSLLADGMIVEKILVNNREVSWASFLRPIKEHKACL